MEKKSGALVTVRASSSRLREKCFQKLTDELCLLQIVIRRAKRLGCPVVVATSVDPSDDGILKLAEAEDVACYRGVLKNKILRWAQCFEEMGFDQGLLVDGDDPTFDYHVGKRGLEILERGMGNCEVVVASPDIFPGFFTYGITRGGINKLARLAAEPDMDTDVITHFMEKAGLVKSEIPALKKEIIPHKVRLTIDYEEDVQFYRNLFKLTDYMTPGPETVETAVSNGLGKINWHKHEEFLENQRLFNEKVSNSLADSSSGVKK
ncbi:MAG: acylneuraminate cytidylyltransferase [Nitrosomonadaceae bacterium]|nr:acylneuraminate cytidylyltransferase [Nitrosomonadaceae bacterium]|tara:strand:+ start:187 stop:978 length:792 start_codon:yes stop_codon:yes gene_type:complete